VTRPQLIILQIANLLVVGTGLVYAWMRYAVTPTDEWAVVNHPLQPLLQHLHVLAAPLLVFAIGLIWSVHVVAKPRNGHRNRAAGIGLMALFLPMVASGYLLQVAVDESWRERWMWVHVTASLAWIATFVIHQIRARFSRSRNQSEIIASAAVIRGSQLSAAAFNSSSVAAGGRQRRVSSSEGARAESRADSTSSDVGAAAT
jgi:hypothetical protein